VRLEEGNHAEDVLRGAKAKREGRDRMPNAHKKRRGSEKPNLFILLQDA